MKGKFKKLIAVLLALVAAFAAFACGEIETPAGSNGGTGDNGSTGDTTVEEPEVVDHTGTYYAVDENGEFVDEKYCMTLKADGTFEVYGGYTGTYSIDGETITMSNGTDSETAAIKDNKISAGGVTYLKESVLKARSYSVKFVTNGGGEIADVAATFGEKLTMPEAPKKDGYWFAGWYTTPELKGRYDKNALVRKSFTLYAKWNVAIEMPITGIDGSTDFDPDDETVDIYVDTDVTSFDFTGKVHIKDGWTWKLIDRDDNEIVNKTAENLGYGFNRVFIYTVSTEGKVGETYRMNIYRKAFVDVTFVSSRDESVLRSVKCKTYEPIPCPSDIKPDHYTITGWEYLHSESEYGKYYIAVNSETILDPDMVKDGKFTVRAIMEPDVYTVTMIDNDGEITDKDGNKVHKLTMSFDYEEYGQLPAPTRYGYYFRGWYYGTDENADKFTDEDGKFRRGELGENITVYARWELGYYFWYLKNTDTAAGSLSYNKEGGGANSLESQETATYYYGETMTVTAVPKDGYTFTGWHLSTDFGETFIKVSEGDSLTLDCDWAFWVKYGEDIRYHNTLYARWEKFTVREYCGEGGTVSDGTTDYTHAVTASDKFTLTATAKDGYIFCGWRKGNVLEYSERVSDIAITEITMEKNWVTYYADFRRNPVTVNNPSAGKVTVEYVGDSWGMRFKFTAITLDDSYYFKGWYKGENPDVTKISEGNGENYYHHFGFKDEVPVYTAVWLKKS